MSTESLSSHPHEHTRTGTSADSLRRAFVDNLFYVIGRPWDIATDQDKYMAAAYTVRDRLLDGWLRTAATYRDRGARTVSYLSAEFLLGPHLENNVLNLGLVKNVREAARELGVDIEHIIDQEEEPGLGNGGLGRLAACYLDSMATLRIPSIGYGIRYEYGIFDQEIRDGWQMEISDLWLRDGNPWELARPKVRFTVKLGGRTDHAEDGPNGHSVNWIPDMVVDGVAYDTPIPGYGVENTNLLRLWRSQACSAFDFQAFNVGDYYRAVDEKIVAENISKVLYPNDEPEAGKELRLQQQYFFVSCSLQDMLRLYQRRSKDLERFYDKFVVQLNDTHPSIAVAELMRLLVDEHGIPWDRAWDTTRRTFAFTNHTLLPEALETWSVDLFGRLLPRHLEIIYEINRRFLDEVRVRYPDDPEKLSRLSLIDEGPQRRVRMAHLATVGAFAVNGVAALHSELLQSTVMRDFSELWPDKFHNVTNGVTPRRFLALANPELASLITHTIGGKWIADLDQLRKLEPLADDPAFQEKWRAVKLRAKTRLAERILQRTGVTVDPNTLFDVQVKRIHEYKRQHLNILHVVALYRRLKENPALDLTPRTFVYAGKAAPGYTMAKLIIKLINSVGSVVNQDPQVNDRLRVVFSPDFNVKNAQFIYPAAELSEQISTAGKEASGTGNMKFMMNGALTIGTLDGANVEMREEVGAENFFLFGASVDEVSRRRAEGYRPWELYESDPVLKGVIDMVASGHFSGGNRALFAPLVHNLTQSDPFMVLGDFASYAAAQEEVDRAYRDRESWCRMSILNTARVGKFSSDRSIRDYCEKIWNVEPVEVEPRER